jgi:hypothetical protein
LANATGARVIAWEAHGRFKAYFNIGEEGYVEGGVHADSSKTADLTIFTPTNR